MKVATVRLLQEEIKFCYRHEGTNHYQNCRELTHKYRQMIKVGFAAARRRRRRRRFFSGATVRTEPSTIYFYAAAQDPYFNWYKPPPAGEAAAYLYAATEE